MEERRGVGYGTNREQDRGGREGGGGGREGGGGGRVEEESHQHVEALPMPMC